MPGAVGIRIPMLHVAKMAYFAQPIEWSMQKMVPILFYYHYPLLAACNILFIINQTQTKISKQEKNKICYA